MPSGHHVPWCIGVLLLEPRTVLIAARSCQTARWVLAADLGAIFCAGAAGGRVDVRRRPADGRQRTLLCLSGVNAVSLGHGCLQGSRASLCNL